MQIVALNFKRIDTSVTVANEAGALVLGLEAMKPFDDAVVICSYAAHACFNIDIYWGKL